MLWIAFSFDICKSDTSALAGLGCYINILSLIVDVQKLWDAADSGGWRSSSVPRSDWPHI
ncbi:hypothetical protein HanPI659440_Chr05g0194181 [Helianthus annuus]|nr:hypothetical protein HanOQP8_Chr05g0179631 [Helianthus annuus]KAJ0788644.1 hypothetical protein HanPI659440_Chr05g0194181 [Helianthus annuus]